MDAVKREIKDGHSIAGKAGTVVTTSAARAINFQAYATQHRSFLLLCNSRCFATADDNNWLRQKMTKDSKERDEKQGSFFSTKSGRRPVVVHRKKGRATAFRRPKGRWMRRPSRESDQRRLSAFFFNFKATKTYGSNFLTMLEKLDIDC